MPKQTNFLNLILPEKNEFVDSWNEPVNQNSEDLDNFLEDLHDSLVAVSSTSTWAALRGSLDSLAERLNVSINADGTIDISTAPDVIDMSTSEVRGQFSGPRDRLNDGDHEIYDARQPVADGRFVPMAAGGPSAGYPGENIDSGMALRSADFGANSGSPLGSPAKPSLAGLVTGGGANLILGLADSQVRFTGDSTPAVFNIDGYIFRIREQVDLDYSLLSPNVGDHIWLFVARNETGPEPYGHAQFQYNQDGGFATKDLRRRQEGADGVTSGSVFTSASAKFTTAILGKVKPGDTLVIESGAALGEYVISAIDVTLTDTKLTIKGLFHANLSGLSWHIQDDSMPNIGAVVTDGDPTTEPPYAAGRVYVGRVVHVNAAPPSPRVSFAKAGVFDSGWVAVDAAVLAVSPLLVPHLLGVLPTNVEIQVRSGALGQAYQPMVERPLVTKMTTGNFPDPLPGDTSTDTFLVPSVRWHSTNTSLTVRLKNESSDPALGPSLFTDSGGAEVTVGEMRVVVRR